MTVVITTMDQMKTYAGDLLQALRRFRTKDSTTFLTLEGPLGAGKTTLVQHLASLLGVSVPVTSPTFTLRSEYETTDALFQSLVHIDAYRIEGDRDGATLGWHDLSCNGEMLVAVEWPERVQSFLPEHRYDVTITLDGDTRTITAP
ncbi:MAG: tRNA (adenosine(37)-N6)-threonylcarbamoyltransferase complex ATPase subunit type 1 TsaE [Candidatus Kaiserbacteria bacterium]|nr:tRNA (adenosine(37)-N6)-threonylcarbamoyltransferase complex ATPase subunit type 1 TsaE [Candidatus Kaiserbacteria bacterium]